MLQSMLHIGLRLLPVYGAEVIGRDDALAELLQLGALQDGPKLRLADEEALQQRAVLHLEV